MLTAIAYWPEEPYWTGISKRFWLDPSFRFSSSIPSALAKLETTRKYAQYVVSVDVLFMVAVSGIKISSGRGAERLS